MPSRASVRAAMPPPAQWTEIAKPTARRCALDRGADISGDVTSQCTNSARSPELVGDRSTPLVVHVGDDDLGALRVQAAGRRLAQPRRRAGYDCDIALDLHSVAPVARSTSPARRERRDTRRCAGARPARPSRLAGCGSRSARRRTASSRRRAYGPPRRARPHIASSASIDTHASSLYETTTRRASTAAIDLGERVRHAAPVVEHALRAIPRGRRRACRRRRSARARPTRPASPRCGSS